MALQTIAAEKMGDRVSVQAGDFMKDDLAAGYDVALLFNIIHGYLPDQNAQLFQKVHLALNPGGIGVIWDQFAGRMFGLPAFKAGIWFYTLTALVTQGGQNYSSDEVSRWLAAAGFAKIRKPLGVPLLMATKVG